jgi:hypothetical protein
MTAPANTAIGVIAARITQGWVAELCATTHFGALMVGDPTVTSDPLSVELIAPGYRRPACVFENVGQLARLAAPIAWMSLPPQSRVVGVAGFDAVVNGQLTFWCPYDEPLDFPMGGSYSLDRDDIYLGVQ